MGGKGFERHCSRRVCSPLWSHHFNGEQMDERDESITELTLIEVQNILYNLSFDQQIDTVRHV